ncbi:hypothetical protein BDB01DRAFT_855935 [Pilobolus umbonatus]|nr:hypothetical protein BDB01DRAFT_855935 [Pilobolus umbonatus]
MKPLRIWLQLEDERSGRKQRIKFQATIERNGYPSDWTPIEPYTNKFQRGTSTQLSIGRTQFLVVIAEAITIHKSQGATFLNVMLNLSKGTAPTRSSLYVACSRATSASGLYIIKKSPFVKTSALGPNEPITQELRRLETVQLIPRFAHLQDPNRQHFQVVSHNVQSLNAHLVQIVTDQVYLCSDILLFNKTWSTARHQFVFPGDAFTEVARVDVCGNTPKAYGSISYLSQRLLSRIGIYTIIEGLHIDDNGSISISGFTNPHISIFSCYISPRCNIDRALLELDNYLARFPSNIILTGDFNINFNKESPKKTSFYALVQQYGLVSIMPASMNSATNSGTYIDDILTNFPVLESGRYISHTSYHDPLYANFKL